MAGVTSRCRACSRARRARARATSEMYRLQVFDIARSDALADPKGGASTSACRERPRMPVAIALGGDPAMIYAASAPLPRRRRGRLRGWCCAARGGSRAARHRRRGAGAQPRSCGRATWIRRAAARGPVRRPYGVLLAGPRVPRLPSHGGHATRAADYPTTIVWRHPRKIFGLARQPEAPIFAPSSS